MMRWTLDWRDGHLCARTSDVDLFRPVRRTTWYPVQGGAMAHQRAADQFTLGAELTEWRLPGVFIHQYADPDLPRVEFRVDANAGPVARVCEDVPRPPARGKELRWHDGRWQRRMASGWRDA